MDELAIPPGRHLRVQLDRITTSDYGQHLPQPHAVMHNNGRTSDTEWSAQSHGDDNDKYPLIENRSETQLNPSFLPPTMSDRTLEVPNLQPSTLSTHLVTTPITNVTYSAPATRNTLRGSVPSLTAITTTQQQPPTNHLFPSVRIMNSPTPSQLSPDSHQHVVITTCCSSACNQPIVTTATACNYETQATPYNITAPAVSQPLGQQRPQTVSREGPYVHFQAQH